MVDPDCDPSTWLAQKVTEAETDANPPLMLPLTDDKKEYTICMLKGQQLPIFAHIMSKVIEWMETEDLSNFKPLRMIVNGPGGCGKSVLINTVVTYMRKLFDSNHVVKVAAPTGTAAYNAGGETFHHMLNMAISNKEYVAETMSDKSRRPLIEKFKYLLALIIDERSLVNNQDLGTTSCKIAETLYQGGHMRDESFGGLPIVILVGDDYQLPGVKEGALGALDSTNIAKMTARGRDELFRCANTVMELKVRVRQVARLRIVDSS